VYVAAAAPIFIYADASRVPLRVAIAGTRLKVIKVDGDWYNVEFQDPQYGPRIGFIEKKYLKIEAPDLRPMDLSVPASRPVTTVPDQPVPEPAAIQRPSFQGSPSRPLSIGGFVNIGFGVNRPATEQFEQTSTVPYRQETATFRTQTDVGVGPVFDVYGGVLFKGLVGFSVGISNYVDENAQGRITTSIPHPTRFNNPATDTSDPDELKRTEQAFHVDFVVAPLKSSKAFLLLFAGPSRVTVKQKLISDLDLTEFFNVLTLVHSINITDLTIVDSDTTALGFNVGVSASYMFTGNVGIGGTVRFTSATTDMRDPLQSREQDRDVTQRVKVGGASALFGLTLRFGQ